MPSHKPKIVKELPPLPPPVKIELKNSNASKNKKYSTALRHSYKQPCIR
jgi:hypothetical protein